MNYICSKWRSIIIDVLFQTKIAHREQVALTIDLDDLSNHDPDLCDAVVENTRRYVSLFGDVIQDVLPTYKQKEVISFEHCIRFYNSITVAY